MHKPSEKLSKIFSTTIYIGFLIFVLSLPFGYTTAFLNTGLSLILIGWVGRIISERRCNRQNQGAAANINWNGTPLALPIVLFLTLALIASLFAPHPSTSSLGYFWKLLRGILLFYAVIHSGLGTRWRYIMGAFILAAGISSALGIWFYANDEQLAVDFMGRIPLEYQEELPSGNESHLSEKLRTELRKHRMPLSATAVFIPSKRPGEFWIKDVPRDRRYTIRKTESDLMIYMIEPRLTGTFKMPNDLGAYLALTLPLVLGYFLASVRTQFVTSDCTRPRLFYAIGRFRQRTWITGILALILALMAVNLALTLTRAAWVSVTVATLCIGCYWLSVQKKRRWLYLSVLLVCFSVFLIPFLFNFKPLRHITDRFYTMVAHPAGFMGERPQWWQMSVQLIQRHPLTGIGLGRFRHEYQLNTLQEQYDTPYHAHNIYLHIAVEHGIPSLFVFLWMLLIIWRRVFSMRNANDFWGIGCFIGASGFLISALIYGLADNILHHRSLLIFWFIVGLIFYTEHTDQNYEKTPESN